MGDTRGDWEPLEAAKGGWGRSSGILESAKMGCVEAALDNVESARREEKEVRLDELLG